MSSQNIKFDSSNLTAELFYSAFLSLPEAEKETFISRLLNSLNSKAVVITSSGKFLSKKEYSAHVEAISREVKEGNFISHNDIVNTLE